MSDERWVHRQPTLLPGRAIPAAHLYRLREVVFGFFMWMTFGMYALYVVRDAGLTPLQLLLAGALLEFTVVAFEIPTGVLADTISRRFSVILGSFVTGAGWAVMGLFPSFEGILAGEFLWGLGFTFISGANDAWLADEVGEDRAATIYPQAAQWRQAAVVAGVLAAAAFAFLDLRLPFLVGGGGGIALGVFLAATMTEAGWRPAPREGRSQLAEAKLVLVEAFHAARIRPLVRAAVGIRLLVGGASEVFYRLYGYHLLENIGVPEAVDEVLLFGGIVLASQVGAFGVIAVGRRASRDGSRAAAARVLMVLYAVAVLGPLAFAFAPGAGVAVVLIAVTQWAHSAERPFFTMWVNRGLESRTRASVLSGIGQADSLGQTISALSFGALAAATSVRLALALGAVFAAPGLGFVRTKPLEERERQEGTAASDD